MLKEGMITLKKLKVTLLTLAVSSIGATSMNALITNDANVTPGIIFGSGNANGSFTVDTQNDIELGLRGKLRHNASGLPENTFNSNGDGTYSFDAGVGPTQSSSTAVWSFEWAINSSLPGAAALRALNQLTYVLGIDIDPSAGTSFITFDPINGINPGLGSILWDHSMGDNGTTAATDLVAGNITDYATNISSLNVAQQSWKPSWFIPGFDPTVDGTYDFYLSASDNSGELARTSIQIIAGKGGAPVPDSGSALLMLSASLLGMLGIRRFIKK